ncbi:MAG: transposase, partial [Rhodobacteraceae bacterium]|nr:transposase [Paracoccaceae bacterium]
GRAKELAGIFAIRIHAYAVMSNHYHLVLHVDQEQAAQWDDQEVAARWRQLFANAPELDINAEGPPDVALGAKVAQWRERLTDISWFMRCLNEHIARRANAEDGCKGRFWEGRFKCQALLDEGALLACMVYVDLNPIRAGVADSPEQSDFTSIKERLLAHQQEQAVAGSGAVDLPTVSPNEPAGAQSQPTFVSPSPLTGFAPVASMPTFDLGVPAGIPAAVAPPIVPLTFEDYAELVDWTGRAIRDGKKGAIPAGMLPVFRRLELQEQGWLGTVTQWGRQFHRAPGSLERLRGLSRRVGQHWFQGTKAAQAMYALPDTS